jgi:hypothetical protein
MTKLPVATTPVEAEALAYARRLIARFHADGTPWGPMSPLEVPGNRAFIRHVIRPGLFVSAVTRMILVGAARAGDEDAILVLRDYILEAKSRRQELPAEIHAYDMELTLHGGSSRRPPPGPKRKNKFYRNIIICMVTSAVAGRFGLAPTGRQDRRRRSAASIVAEALVSEAQISIGEKGVERLWGEIGRNMPTGPVWADALAADG